MDHILELQNLLFQVIAIHAIHQLIQDCPYILIIDGWQLHKAVH